MIRLKFNRRIAVKAIVWEILGLILIFILTGSLKTSITYILLRTIMYYFYHIIWKKIKWGKKVRK